MKSNLGFRIFAPGLILAVSVVTVSVSEASVMNYPGLTGIQFWEVSGPTTPYTFLPSSSEMTTQLGVLNGSSNDFQGVPSEAYDVFYSDANGAFNLNGNYVTIETTFAGQSGGGLNMAAVDLLLGPAPSMVCRADILASWLGLGSNYISGSEVSAVDADTAVPSTFTTMGNTAGTTQRLRVTVGWTKILVPEPSACLLLVSGLVGMMVSARRRR